MRVGLFTDTFPPEINGVSNSTNILRNVLEDHGHTVFVVCPGKKKEAYWDEGGKVLRIPGIELPFLYGYVMTSPFHKELIKTVEDMHLDIIHVQTEFGVGLFARTCAKELGIPMVETNHTTWEDYTHYINPLHVSFIEKQSKKGVRRATVKLTDSVEEVISPSEKTKQLLIDYGVTKPINVIPTGLDLSKFSADLRTDEARLAKRKELGYTADDRIVIYVGRLAEEKDLEMVISGVKKANEEGAGVKLLIIGGGPDLERLQELVKSENLTDSVQLTGPKPIDEVPAYYACADAFASASLSETQGMTFIEALASGLPLFARHDDVVAELIDEGKTGWYFDNADELAAGVKNFAAMSKEELVGMRDDCIKKVEPYSNEVFYQRMIEVYERVVKKNRK